MDKQEYLNQISTYHEPKKSGLPNLLKSKYFWAVIGCVLFIVLILMVGSMATSGKKTVKDRVIELILHVDYTKEAVDEYAERIKSARLRGYASGLSSILGDTSKKITDYATANYEFKPKKIDKKVQAAADKDAQELTDALFDARINGDLDNMFDVKMVYEISTIMSQEEVIMQETSKDELKGILDSSYNSLSSLYTDFDEYEVGM